MQTLVIEFTIVGAKNYEESSNVAKSFVDLLKGAIELYYCLYTKGG